MKKIILSLSLALALMFTVGCSCSDPVILSFEKLWTSTYSDSFEEVLEYDVSYTASYSENGRSYKKDAALDGMTVEIGGTYTVKNKVYSKVNTDLPSEVKNAEVLTNINSFIIHTRSELSLNTKYVYGSHDSGYLTEYINVDAYYADTDTSLTPVYVSREFSYYNLTVDSDFNLNKLEGSDQTLYSTDAYTVKTKYGDNQSANDYSYTFKTLIDNSALFMTIRNKNVAKDASYNLPVVHPSYGTSQELTLSTFAVDEQTYSLNYYGTDKELKFPVRGTSFVVNSMNESGTSQICYVQTASVDGANNSLLLKYVEPIAEYKGYKKLGAMIYTLKSVTNNA